MKIGIGHDPGAVDGAVVALARIDGAYHALAGGWWRRVQRQKQHAWCVTDTLGTEREYRTLAEVGSVLARAVDYAVGADDEPAYIEEGLYLGSSSRRNVRTLVVLADARGEVGGPFRRRYRVLGQPTAAEWRPRVLGLNRRARSADATRSALLLVPRMVQGMGALAEVSHACEAACMAIYGLSESR